MEYKYDDVMMMTEENKKRVVHPISNKLALPAN
jgi:hypothetical protein